MFRISILFLLLTINIIHLSAQETEPIEFYGAFQLWMRYTELNPGSAIGSEEFNDAFDISLRRYRLGVEGRPYKDISFNFGIGNNNLSRFDINQPPKVLDAYVSYHFSDKFIITGGKHGWTGISRFAAPSTTSAMGFDINFSATPALNVHDDLLRKLAVAVRGQIHKVDYRIIFAKPFVFISQPLSAQAAFVDNPTSLNFSGYLKYQFLDKESLNSAFSPWTYLGKNEIFNIGAGWTYQPLATQSLNTEGDTLDHPMRSFGVDVFYDKPIGNHSVTFYAVYLNHFLGPDFVRYIGANNPSSGTIQALTLNGRGNSFPEAGTGDILFTYLGYMRKLDKLGVQPNFLWEIAHFDALDDPMILYQGGVNFLLDGHRSKLSLGYQNRPVFIERSGRAKVADRKAMVVLQYQLVF